MAILFACQSPNCPHRDVVTEFLGEPVAADCECGAAMEPVELDDDREAA